MKIAILNDTHCGVRNSSDIFLDYQEDFYSNIFFPYLKENNITNILHLGDYYDHRKYVNFKAQNHNRRIFLNILKENDIKMDIIAGNHDVFYKNTNELSALKELLGYYTDNVNIVQKPSVLDYDGCKIGLVPWINSENYEESMNFLNSCETSIIAGHFEIAGIEMHKGVSSTHGMSLNEFNRFETVMSGHYHTKSTTGNIQYFGSQMEFTWADAEDPKYFHIFDTETREITAVRNPITIFKKIYYDDTKTDYTNIDLSDLGLDKSFVKIIVINKSDPFTFDKFCDKIQTYNIHELKIAENFEEFLGENVEDNGITIEDTTELMNGYIDIVDTDLDKNKIKEIMRSLYVEASNSEIA